MQAVYLDDLPCFGDPPTHPDVGASADPHEAVDDATIAAVADAVEMEYANRCAIHAAQFPAINAAAAPKPSPPPTPRTRGGAGAGVGAGAGDFAARMGLADGVGADVARVAAHAVGNAAAAASAATTAASAAASQLASDASKGMRKMFNAGRFLAKVGMKRVMSGGGRAGKVPTVDALVNVQDMQVCPTCGWCWCLSPRRAHYVHAVCGRRCTSTRRSLLSSGHTNSCCASCGNPRTPRHAWCACRPSGNGWASSSPIPARTFVGAACCR